MKKSESIKEISIALSKLGSELGNATKNSSNPFFKSKYADLASILNYVKPALAEHDLSIIQSSRPGETNSLIVETLITHISGEWIETEIELPGEKDKKYNPQTVGSAFTYGRRYGLSAALNISSEDDNDGNSTVQQQQIRKPALPVGNYDEILKHISLVKSKDELKSIYSGLASFTWTEDETVKLKYHASQKAESFEDNSDLVGAADKVKDTFKGEKK